MLLDGVQQHCDAECPGGAGCLSTLEILFDANCAAEWDCVGQREMQCQLLLSLASKSIANVVSISKWRSVFLCHFWHQSTLCLGLLKHYADQ